jgi:hypothetical protein
MSQVFDEEDLQAMAVEMRSATSSEPRTSMSIGAHNAAATVGTHTSGGAGREKTPMLPMNPQHAAESWQNLTAFQSPSSHASTAARGFSWKAKPLGSAKTHFTTKAEERQSLLTEVQ